MGRDRNGPDFTDSYRLETMKGYLKQALLVLVVMSIVTRVDALDAIVNG